MAQARSWRQGWRSECSRNVCDTVRGGSPMGHRTSVGSGWLVLPKMQARSGQGAHLGAMLGCFNVDKRVGSTPAQTRKAQSGGTARGYAIGQVVAIQSNELSSLHNLRNLRGVPKRILGVCRGPRCPDDSTTMGRVGRDKR